MDEREREARPSEAIGESRFTRRDVMKGAVAVAGSVALGSLLTACGDGTTTSASPTAAAASPQRGGTLKVGIAGGFGAKDTLDAQLPTTEPDIAIHFQMYECLVGRDNKYQKFNQLAQELTASPDARVWTARLRDGVTFHSGKTMTADDVVYSFKRIITKNTGGKAQLAGLKVSGVRKVDSTTVRFVLDEPNSVFDDGLSYYLNAIVPVDYDPKTGDGTGPFKLGRFRAGEECDFVRFDGYWQEPALVDGVQLIQFADDTARVNALMSGDVDMISQLPGAQMATVEASPGYKVLRSPTGGWLPFCMRVDVEPFSDVRVRQAFRLIADREQLLQQAISGLGAIGNDLYARYDPVYLSAAPQRTQDLEQAKSLLKQAGKEGLAVKLDTTATAAGLVEASQVFAQQAEGAGVTVQVNKIDPSAYWTDYLKYPFTVDFWYTRDYLPQCAAGSLPDAPYNETHWDDPEWIALVREAFRTVDADKRKELCQAAQQIEYDRGGYIIWGFNDQIGAYSDKVLGAEQNVFAPLMSWRFDRVSFA